MHLFEQAYNQGPEAIIALRDSLSREALDIVADEIYASEIQLAEQAATAQLQTVQVPISPEEELLQLESEREQAATNRAQVLTALDDPAEGIGHSLSVIPQTAVPNHIAADLTVGDGCTYATIAAALQAAQPGDRLLLEGDRTFAENILIDKDITLVGGYSGCATGSVSATTIDGTNTSNVIDIAATLNVTLTNLDLINGNAPAEGGAVRFGTGAGSGSLILDNVTIHDNIAQWGGGIWSGKNTQITGTHVTVYSNTATSYGGGLRLFGGTATFSDSNFYNNTAALGGGVYGSKEDNYFPQLNLPSSADIYDNEAVTSGGGIHMSQGYIDIADCSDIYNNQSVAGGGASLITSTLTINGACSEIENNSVTGDGGGIYAQSSVINIDDSAEIRSNTAGSDNSGSGGGVYLDNSDLWGDKAAIRSNQAATYGGGIYAINSSEVDMDLGDYTCTGSRCSLLTLNTAENSYGGGIYAADSDIDLRQTFIEDNTGSIGGGIYAAGSASRLDLYNNLFAENDATTGTGDGLRLYDAATAVGNGNTFADNNAGGASNGQAVALHNANLTLGCSLIWGHTQSINETGTNTTAVTSSDIQGGYSGTGNINSDPLFVSPAIDDYHVSSSSPVIDQCAAPTGMTTDFDNEVRPIRQTSDTTPYDMGADEYSLPRVGINGNGCDYGTIAQAAAAANDGDTIEVASGTFYENVTMVGDKSITITGGYASDCTTADAGTTIVNGSVGNNSVFRIDGITAVLNNLEITGGNTSYGGGVDLRSGAQVTLDSTHVHDNQANYGGGIYIGSSSALTLTNASNVDNNTAATIGGGIRLYEGQLTTLDTQSDISENNAPEGGGIAATDSTITIENSDLAQNQATDAAGRGGAILLENNSHLSTGGSNVWLYNQNQAYDGAGIYADNSHITLNRTVFAGNQATNSGGAIYLNNQSTLSATHTEVGRNTDAYKNIAVSGAGIMVNDSTLTFQGIIINNVATASGGGLYAHDSTITLADTQIGGTEDYEANQITDLGYGAGIYLEDNSQAALQNVVIAGNILQINGAGGGLYVENSNATLSNSRVENHIAPSTINGRGAGIYADGGQLILDNSQILSNTAEISGGGIRLYASSPTTLTMINDSVIRNNEALTAEGGGIAATGDSIINIADATLIENTAATDGGGIAINSGTLDFTGGLTLRQNDAGDNGGGLAVTDSAIVNFNLQNYSLIYDNDAATGDGGAFYLGNTQPINLNMTGSSIYIYANHAGHHGGAAYVGGNTTLTTQGTVNFDYNWANNGHGGAIYVADGGALSLEADGNNIPALWDNRAYSGNGGAIYAAANSVIRCNQAAFGKEGEGNLSSTGSGGSLYLESSSFEANNCTFIDGQAAVDGGAIAANDSTMTIATDETTCDPAANRCSEFAGNIADSDGDDLGYGGAIYTEDSHVDIEQTTFHDNEAARGGALYHKGATVQDAHITLENTLIYSNTVSEAFGSGVRTSYVHITATHVTLANNTGGAAFSPSSSTARVTNSIAWGNDGGFVRTYEYTNCNIDEEGTVGLYVDPEFVAAAAGDFHLAEPSPAVDVCATGLDEDLVGTLRPEGDGYDMGAYEYILEDYYIYLPMIIK